MFFVNYDPETGKILSYSGGGSDDSDNLPPSGAETLKFASEIPGFINSNGVCMMKVDVVNKLLIFTNPVMIPKPIG